MTHHHQNHEGKASSSPVRAVLIGTAVLILLLAATFAGLKLRNPVSATEAEDSQRSAERIKNLADLQAADKAKLTTYGWNDRAKGIVHIPVTKAMELVLPTLNAKASAPQQ
jgi:hypothetical protein